MVMLNVIGFVRISQRHPNRFHFRAAEIFEQEVLQLAFDSLVEIAAPPIGTQLARPQDENVAANNLNPFHKSHLLYLEWPQVPGDED
jgi:hypothetical protein